MVAGEPTPDCGLVTDITLRACAGIYPIRLGSADGSIFEQLPAKPSEGLAMTLLERTGAVLLAFLT